MRLHRNHNRANTVCGRGAGWVSKHVPTRAFRLLFTAALGKGRGYSTVKVRVLGFSALGSSRGGLQPCVGFRRIK